MRLEIFVMRYVYIFSLPRFVICSHLEAQIIYSFNSIHWGLASKVAMTAERLRWMGKAVRYTTAALLELLNGHSSWAAIQFEDSEGNVVEYKEKFCLAIANNIPSRPFFFINIYFFIYFILFYFIFL
jgi:hypothetical protein